MLPKIWFKQDAPVQEIQWAYGTAENMVYILMSLMTNFLTTTIAIGMPKNLHSETFKLFQAVLPGQKQLCVFFRNKYGYQIGNATKEILCFGQEEILTMA